MTEVRNNCNTMNVSPPMHFIRHCTLEWINVVVSNKCQWLTIILNFRLCVGLNGISRGPPWWRISSEINVSEADKNAPKISTHNSKKQKSCDILKMEAKMSMYVMIKKKHSYITQNILLLIKYKYWCVAFFYRLFPTHH